MQCVIAIGPDHTHLLFKHFVCTDKILFMEAVILNCDTRRKII